MRVLVTGANGFIGSQIVATLLEAGHQVVCAARNIENLQRQFPTCDIMSCDFNIDTEISLWEQRLLSSQVSAVVNCVGILQEKKGDSIKAIHELAPIALFDACQKMEIKKIIHISALGTAENLSNAFSKTKYAADSYLSELAIDWIILRPSLVYGQRSYGGTSLFRGLAALPILPVIGEGQQLFQPIAIQDLALAVLSLLEREEPVQKILDAVGTEQLTFTQVLTIIRRWLRFAPTRIFHVPLLFIKAIAKMGDWFGKGPVNSTSLQMLSQGNFTSEENAQAFFETIGFEPKTMVESLEQMPASVQDRWHARLYFLKPLLRISLALLWIFSGIVSCLTPLEPKYQLLVSMGIPHSMAPLVLFSVALLDIGLGVAILFAWRLHLINLLQIIVILFYTLICMIFLPHLWLDPFAPLLKNVLILVATLILMAMAEDR